MPEWIVRNFARDIGNFGTFVVVFGGALSVASGMRAVRVNNGAWLVRPGQLKSLPQHPTLDQKKKKKKKRQNERKTYIVIH